MSEAPEPALMTLIAREMATELRPFEKILEKYLITQDFFDAEIAPNPFFQRVLADYTKEWHSLGSTQKRLAFSALVALEEKLPVLADRMGSRQSELSDAIAAAKLFKDLAGIAPPMAAPGGNNERFTISINLGNNAVKIEAEPTKEILDLSSNEAK
jgi:hypothetical protein